MNVFTPEVGFKPQENKLSADNRMSFFEAISKSGTATNYINAEIKKSYDNIRLAALGEVKFFAGVLISIAALSAVLKFMPEIASNTEEEEVGRAIFVVYLLMVLCIIVRTAMALKMLPPYLDDKLKLYIVNINGKVFMDFEIKEDHQWAKLICPDLIIARSREKRERIFKLVFLWVMVFYIAWILMILDFTTLLL